jgi:hypothetical protein
MAPAWAPELTCQKATLYQSREVHPAQWRLRRVLPVDHPFEARMQLPRFHPVRWRPCGFGRALDNAQHDGLAINAARPQLVADERAPGRGPPRTVSRVGLAISPFAGVRCAAATGLCSYHHVAAGIVRLPASGTRHVTVKAVGRRPPTTRECCTAVAHVEDPTGSIAKTGWGWSPGSGSSLKHQSPTRTASTGTRRGLPVRRPATITVCSSGLCNRLGFTTRGPTASASHRRWCPPSISEPIHRPRPTPAAQEPNVPIRPGCRARPRLAGQHLVPAACLRLCLAGRAFHRAGTATLTALVAGRSPAEGNDQGREDLGLERPAPRLRLGLRQSSQGGRRTQARTAPAFDPPANWQR